MIVIRPEKYKQLGESENCDFVLLTNSEFSDKFEISTENDYLSKKIIACDTPESFHDILDHQKLARQTHFLVISPHALFSSPPAEKIAEKCKIISMPCNSTEIFLEDINYFLEKMELTDPDAQKAWADHFFDHVEESDHIQFVDKKNGCEAVFLHDSDEYCWFEQLGRLSWGEQQFVPSGEISVLPLFHGNYNAEKRLNIQGEIAFRGYPIVNNGSVSFLREDQNRIFDALESLYEIPIIATVENGIITSLRSDIENHPAIVMLEKLFDIDSRYRIIWEIGFGTNQDIYFQKGNRSPNECYGGSNGTVHWGLGLTPWTQYHIDIICPDTVVYTSDEVIIAGEIKEKKSLRRVKSAGCPCIS
ncbi:hypothetical protein [Vibrio spartinae]|uniref:2,5-dihydroxypyridine 5,6-dioxygenase n=1 Tax=Vibrio spartinae TaxID=1918945 RepID=A0ABX6QUM8_9VIBR|nr:hypothetical protein [Vibrio spartinae]QMV12915.1 hypothetical protein Vspart_00118 [Vibrio spartinae]